MPAQRVPTVLLPRFTTLAGPATPTTPFTTVAMDVSAYFRAWITFWRGPLIGSQPTPPNPEIRIWFEESIDRVTWSACEESVPGVEPLENVWGQYAPKFSMRWFRLRVELYATDNVITCAATGWLELRER